MDEHNILLVKILGLVESFIQKVGVLYIFQGVQRVLSNRDRFYLLLSAVFTCRFSELDF